MRERDTRTDTLTETGASGETPQRLATPRMAAEGGGFVVEVGRALVGFALAVFHERLHPVPQRCISDSLSFLKCAPPSGCLHQRHGFAAVMVTDTGRLMA